MTESTRGGTCPLGKLDTALVGARKGFAKCNRANLIACARIYGSLSRCELQGAPPTCVDHACRLGMPVERRVRGCLFRFFLRSLGTFASSAVGDRHPRRSAATASSARDWT